MKLLNPDVLQSFRDRRRCEWCLKAGPVDPHHRLAKGMGGGGQIDHRWNLVSLCRECHTAHHYGQAPSRGELLALIAEREHVTEAAITLEMCRILRRRK